MKNHTSDNGAQWIDGRLIIDGLDAQSIVSRAETMGWIRRGAEVFARDNKPVTSKMYRRRPIDKLTAVMNYAAAFGGDE